jgi:hypothetical protein
MNPVFIPSPVNKSFPKMPLTEVVAPVMTIVSPPLLPVTPENIKELPSAETTTDCNGEPKLEGVSVKPVNAAAPPPPKEPVCPVVTKASIPVKDKVPPEVPINISPFSTVLGVSASSVNPVREPDKTVSEVLVKVMPEKARTPPDITGT